MTALRPYSNGAVQIRSWVSSSLFAISKLRLEHAAEHLKDELHKTGVCDALTRDWCDYGCDAGI